jgi:hypothetical protein
MIFNYIIASAVAADVFPIPSPICTNGEVQLGYGSAEFIGLGFSVMCALVVIEVSGLQKYSIDRRVKCFTQYVKHSRLSVLFLTQMFASFLFSLWQIFGSTFMKNTNVFLALLFGYVDLCHALWIHSNIIFVGTFVSFK